MGADPLLMVPFGQMIVTELGSTSGTGLTRGPDNVGGVGLAPTRGAPGAWDAAIGIELGAGPLEPATAAWPTTEVVARRDSATTASTHGDAWTCMAAFAGVPGHKSILNPGERREGAQPASPSPDFLR